MKELNESSKDQAQKGQGGEGSDVITLAPKELERCRAAWLGLETAVAFPDFWEGWRARALVDKGLEKHVSASGHRNAIGLEQSIGSRRAVIPCPPAAKGLSVAAYCAEPTAPQAKSANPLAAEDLEILREDLRELIESARSSLSDNPHWPCSSPEEYEEFERWRADNRDRMSGVKP